MSGIYLVEHPPKKRQFRPRTEKPSGVVVVHTAESAPDITAEDRGAEAVAKFIQGRSDYGSYHILCDSDSIIHLVRYVDQAYGDGTGSNSHAFHVSAATRADLWDSMPEWWREDTVEMMAVGAADYARWIKKEHGIVIPARFLTRDESEARKPGFISHARRDPGRRSDPGQHFPWELFFRLYEEEMNPVETRGAHVDEALKAARQAVKSALEIKGGPVRQEAADEAVKHLRLARRALKKIPAI